MDIQEEIQNFMSTHECVISREMSDKDIKSNFTTFGNRAGCRAIKDIIEVLDDDVKLKVLDMMKNKRVK
jgi:hypothetical protein